MTVNSYTYATGATIVVRGTCWKASAPATITLHSTPALLGTPTADAAGNWELTTTIPCSATPGQHLVTGDGFNWTTNAATTSKAIEVAGTVCTGSSTTTTPAQVAGLTQSNGGSNASPSTRTGASLSTTLWIAFVTIAAGMGIIAIARGRRAKNLRQA